MNNQFCHLDWPCAKPKQAAFGVALAVTSIALGLLVSLVATRSLGAATISGGAAFVLTAVTLVGAVLGTFLAKSSSTRTPPVESQKD
ncbi:MAG: hypothetical protein K0U13_02150 [Chlamydiae bacterium]|nr:hypothetical protein [Chlamydiota bacterium]